MMFVPGLRTLTRKRALARSPGIDRRDLKETGVRGRTELSGRNVNLSDVRRGLRTRASNRRE